MDCFIVFLDDFQKKNLFINQISLKIVRFLNFKQKRKQTPLILKIDAIYQSLIDQFDFEDARILLAQNQV